MKEVEGVGVSDFGNTDVLLVNISLNQWGMGRGHRHFVLSAFVFNFLI